MHYPPNRVLIVIGPEKTATSSLTKLLNTHSRICILFEVYMHTTLISKYSNRLLDKFPDTRHYFTQTCDVGNQYALFFSHMAKVHNVNDYMYVGGKINSLEPWKYTAGYPVKALITLRDVRSWLVKFSIVKHYRTDLDVVIPTIGYLKAVVGSFLIDHAKIVWMEELVLNNYEVIDGISEYLNMDLSSVKDTWWSRDTNLGNDPIKSIFDIDQVHPSSHVEPLRLDTEYTLKSHPFWDEVNSIFDTYYLKTDVHAFSKEQIQSDMDRIDKLLRFAPLRLEEVYEEVHTERFQTPKQPQRKLLNIPSFIPNSVRSKIKKLSLF